MNLPNGLTARVGDSLEDLIRRIIKQEIANQLAQSIPELVRLISAWNDGSNSSDAIADSGLSFRAKNSLTAAGITSFTQLAEMTDYSLSRLRNLGRITRNEIKVHLLTRNLKLKDGDSLG